MPLSSEVPGRRHTRHREATSRVASPRDCDIRLAVPARPENVGMIRRVAAAVAESYGFDAELVEDVRLAVTEACTNVVRHAYRDQDGPLEVRLRPAAGRLTVTVSDRGRGIQPNPDSEGPALGLPLIAALSHSLDIEHAPSRGSTVSMSFHADAGSVEAA